MLPNSQLDRFLVKLTMGYPDFKSRSAFSKSGTRKTRLTASTPSSAREELNALKQRAAAVEMKTSVYEYVTRLAEATRVHPLVQLGLSPRGALAVCRMAKAYAYVQGRDYAMPEDVAAIFPDVCCHRLMLSTKARMMERSAGADRGRNPEKRGNAGDPEEPGGRMTVLRIGYALLLLTVLGLDAFCGSILSAAATALLVLTPLVCVLLHLRAAKKAACAAGRAGQSGKG